MGEGNLDWYDKLSDEAKSALSAGMPTDGRSDERQDNKGFAAWFEQNKERLIVEGVIPSPEDIFKSIYSHTKPAISLTRVPRDEKQIWDESKQGERTKLIEEYLQAVEEVKKDKKLSRSESLKKLLTPLVNLHNTIVSPNYESHRKFIKEDVDLRKELDLKSLIPDTAKYAIIEGTELRELGILRVDNKDVWLSEKYTDYLSFCAQVKPISETEFEKILYKKEYLGQDKQNPLNNALDIEPFLPLYSVSDIYGLWLPTLTQEKIKSNDLLDRILVTYTIKRALNKDGKAIDKLCSLFQDTAEAVAVKMAKKRWLASHINDIKPEAGLLLRLIISGFSPKQILTSLTQNVNFSVPKSVESFFIYWLTEPVPEQLKKYPLIDPFDVLVALYPANLINAKVTWQITPKAVRRFNSYSFRPNSKANLYTWLFGATKKAKNKTITSGHMQGRFCQLFSERLDEYTKGYVDTCVDENNITAGNIQAMPANRQRTQGERATPMFCSKETIEEDIEKEETLEYIESRLLKRGIQERNVKILVLKQKGHSYAEIAKLCEISRRHAIRICKEYESLVEKLITEASEM